MLSHTRRPSAAMIVAVIALVAALAGSAVAMPGKSTIDKNDLKKGAVRAKALKTGSVSNPKLADGSVSSTKIADGQVATVDIADGSVTGPKLAANAVSTDKIGDGQVGTADLADSSVNSAKVAADSLDGTDLAPGVLDVVAYGRINNPDTGIATLGAGSVGINGVSTGNQDEGRSTISIASGLLPAGGLATCTVNATIKADAAATSATTLGFGTITVATGAPAGATHIQAQTRGADGALADYNYFVQVLCPNV